MSYDDSNQRLQLRYNAFFNASNSQFSVNTKYAVSQQKNKLYVDNTLLITATASTFTTNYNLVFWGLNRPSGITTNGGVYRLYSCKIYDNGTLVRDYIPVLDYKGIPCLYDKLNDTFNYNGGTGDFIQGGVI